jgi:hypothetical protein
MGGSGLSGDRLKPVMNRGSVMQPDMNEPTGARHDDVSAARTRASNACKRVLAAREAAEQATTEYARRAHQRVADLHRQLALSHEDFARTLRSRGDAESA